MNPIHTYLDAAILKPEMSRSELDAAIALCLPHKPRTLCVRPCDLEHVTPVCRAHGIGVCVVLGFPHGDQLTVSKVDEARRYIDAGVDEIDMVANFGWARSGMWDAVREDIAAVSRVARAANVPLKVIFETAHLSVDAVKRMTGICVEAGADFVKTSTGFNGGGASPEVVRVMVETAAGRVKVKPSGGIRTREQAEDYVRMGAERLGVGFSSVPALCGDAPASAGAY